MKLTYNGTIKNGSLTIHNRSKMNKEVRSCKDMIVTLIIEKKRVKRSDPQNRYYWSGVLMAAKQGFFDAGHSLTKQDVHDVFKKQYLEGKVITNEETGETLKVGETTTGLTKSEFSDYIEEIRAFCREWLNTEIPEPDEQLSIN